MKFIKKFIGKKPVFKRSSKAEQETALNGHRDARIALASNVKTSPEILYYLAEHDEDTGVRHAVVSNPSTPIQVSTFLAKDKDQDIRVALATRLANMLPTLDHDAQTQHYKIASESLAILALDEVLKIRMALSAALKNAHNAPPKVALQLAQDVERAVSEPILRFCMALSDTALVEILNGAPEAWKISAIATREDVSEALSDAIIDTGDRQAGVALLENENALISESGYSKIVARAREVEEWQRPLALRKALPKEVALEMSGFVEAKIMQILLHTQHFDAETVLDIKRNFHLGLEMLETIEEGASVADRIENHVRKGTLTDETILTASAMQDKAFVIAALAKLSGYKKEIVEKIVALNAPQPFTALIWKAGLSMRTCLTLQRELAKIPRAKLLYPRDGVDFPMSEDDMTWQLELVGAEK